MSLSIIIPVRNEEENVSIISENLSNIDFDFEIQFIDDFSEDNTYDKIIELKQKYNFINVTKNAKPGLGSAINIGIDVCRKNFICIMMCDGSDNLTDLKKYYEIISRENCDAVFGSRFTKQSIIENYPVKKMILNRIFNYGVSILFLNKFNDYTNAFKIYKTSSIKSLKPLISESFNIFLEIPLKIISRKMNYKVTPISWFGRDKGESKFFLGELRSKYLFTLLYCFLEKILLNKKNN
jgi:dolichol-phosphate mannosyltransferase